MGMNKGLLNNDVNSSFETYLLGLPGVQRLIKSNDLCFLYVSSELLVPLAMHLKSDQELKFTALLDIWGTDNLGNEKRFEVNYLFLSVFLAKRVLVRVELSENEGIATLTHVFNSAGWLEREVWDMFGVLFFGNKDLRRILTDYGFEGHPLRKDFPVSGFVEVRYDDGCKRVVYEPIEVAQQYRSFQFTSPWKKENE